MTVNLPEIGTQRRPLPAYRQAPKWDNPSYYEAIKSGHFKLLAKCNSCTKKTRLENTCTVIGFFPKSVGENNSFLWFPMCFYFSKYVQQRIYIWTKDTTLKICDDRRYVVTARIRPTLLPFFDHFWPIFWQLPYYIWQNWSSDGHFEVLNGSEPQLVHKMQKQNWFALDYFWKLFVFECNY